MSLCQGLSVWFRQPHQGVSVCVYICLHVFESRPASSQIQLGPSFLQTFLSCFRSRQARVIQEFLQPVSNHRYESQGDTDTTSQRQLSAIPRKETRGLGEQQQPFRKDCRSMMELELRRALPTGGRCPPGASRLTIRNLTT